MLNQAPPRPSREGYLRALSNYCGKPGLRYSEHTVKAWLSHASYFITVCGVKSAYTRDDVMKFVDWLKEHDYKDRSSQTIMTGVRAMFRALEMNWPVVNRDLRISAYNYRPETPTFDIGEMEQIVRGAKASKYPDFQIALLSTLYGFRNQELANIISGGCDGLVIDMDTVKTGARRVHMIPPQLSKAMCFKGKPMTRFAAEWSFNRLMKNQVREPKHREGWHAVRRSLVTELLDRGLPEFTVSRFMGWSRTETAYKYFQPKGNRIDEEVFALHPYLPFWLKP